MMHAAFPKKQFLQKMSSQTYKKQTKTHKTLKAQIATKHTINAIFWRIYTTETTNNGKIWKNPKINVFKVVQQITIVTEI